VGGSRGQRGIQRPHTTWTTGVRLPRAWRLTYCLVTSMPLDLALVCQMHLTQLLRLSSPLSRDPLQFDLTLVQPSPSRPGCTVSTAARSTARQRAGYQQALCERAWAALRCVNIGTLGHDQGQRPPPLGQTRLPKARQGMSTGGHALILAAAQTSRSRPSHPDR